MVNKGVKNVLLEYITKTEFPSYIDLMKIFPLKLMEIIKILDNDHIILTNNAQFLKIINTSNKIMYTYYKTDKAWTYNPETFQPLYIKESWEDTKTKQIIKRKLEEI